MGTLENTVSMMKALPETDLLEIQNLTLKLFRQRKSKTADEAVKKFLKPMSQEDFIKDIDMAEQEIAEGKYRSANEVFI